MGVSALPMTSHSIVCEKELIKKTEMKTIQQTMLRNKKNWPTAYA
jgi:hypothetical protein